MIYKENQPTASLIIQDSVVKILIESNHTLVCHSLPREDIGQLPKLLAEHGKKQVVCFDHTKTQTMVSEKYPDALSRKDKIVWLMNKRSSFQKEKNIYKNYHLWKNNHIFYVGIPRSSPLYQVLDTLKQSGFKKPKVYSYLIEESYFFKNLALPFLSTSCLFHLLIIYHTNGSMYHWVFKNDHIIFMRSWEAGSITTHNEQEIIAHAMDGTCKLLEKKYEQSINCSIVFFSEAENKELLNHLYQLFPRSVLLAPSDIQAITHDYPQNLSEENSRFEQLVVHGAQGFFPLIFQYKHFSIPSFNLRLPLPFLHGLSFCVGSMGVYFLCASIKMDYHNRIKEQEISNISRKIRKKNIQIKELNLTPKEAVFVHALIEKSQKQWNDFFKFIHNITRTLDQKYFLESLNLKNSICTIGLRREAGGSHPVSEDLEDFFLKFDRHFKKSRRKVPEDPADGPSHEASYPSKEVVFVEFDLPFSL